MRASIRAAQTASSNPASLIRGLLTRRLTGLEARLIDLDPVIDAFAQRAGLTVTKNKKQWPERSIRWENSVNCRIQIFLADRGAVTWNIWLCRTMDEGNRRFWRQEFLIEKKLND